MEGLHDVRPASPDEFLVWAEEQEEKHEFVDGVVVMQAGASRDHERVAKRVFVSLLRQVDEAEFDVNKGDFSVRIGDGNGRGSILLPDVMIDLQSGQGKERATTTPVVVVEVLSPSSDLDHHVGKLRKYARLPSLIRDAIRSGTPAFSGRRNRRPAIYRARLSSRARSMWWPRCAAKRSSTASTSVS